MAELSTAFFQRVAGDEEVIRKYHADNGGLTPEQLDEKSAGYWNRRLRRVVTPAEELVPKLDALLEKYQGQSYGLDVTTGRMLLSDATASVHTAVKELIEKGHICGRCCDMVEWLH